MSGAQVAELQETTGIVVDCSQAVKREKLGERGLKDGRGAFGSFPETLENVIITMQLGRIKSLNR